MREPKPHDKLQFAKGKAEQDIHSSLQTANQQFQEHHKGKKIVKEFYVCSKSNPTLKKAIVEADLSELSLKTQVYKT